MTNTKRKEFWESQQKALLATSILDLCTNLYKIIQNGKRQECMKHKNILLQSIEFSLKWVTGSRREHWCHEFNRKSITTTIPYHLNKISLRVFYRIKTVPKNSMSTMPRCVCLSYRHMLNHCSSLSTGCSPAGFSVPGSVLHTGLAEPRAALPGGGLARVWAGGRLEGRAGVMRAEACDQTYCAPPSICWHKHTQASSVCRHNSFAHVYSKIA